MRKKFFLVLFLGLALVIFTQPVFAGPPSQGATVKNPVTGQSIRTVTVPGTAVDTSPALIPLGLALDHGRLVEGYAIIHYKADFAKGGNKPDHGHGGKPATGNYQFLANGARWKTTEPYVLDTSNDEGLSDAFVAGVVADSMNTWDSEVSFDVFGPRNTAATVDGADMVTPDDKNEIFFGDISSPGAIGVTTVWGIFGGRPANRELVEYDMVLDQVDFDWGYAGPTSENSLGDTSIMDLQNIVTHELGHAAGLADLYESSCSEETMYGYGEEGETKKRTLNTGDIAGITALYK